MEQSRTALGAILIVQLDREMPDAPPAPAADLDPLLQRAIAAGVMTEAQARDVDAFADGVVARVAAGELTEEQGDELVARRATSDAHAELRARARRAEASPAARKRERRRRR